MLVQEAVVFTLGRHDPDDEAEMYAYISETKNENDKIYRILDVNEECDSVTVVVDMGTWNHDFQKKFDVWTGDGPMLFGSAFYMPQIKKRIEEAMKLRQENEALKEQIANLLNKKCE